MRPRSITLVALMALAALQSETSIPSSEGPSDDVLPDPFRSSEKVRAAKAKRARKSKKLDEAMRKGALRGPPEPRLAGYRPTMVILDDLTVDLDQEPSQTVVSILEKQTCGTCTHWLRCKALIQDLTGAETECDFSPSRFRPCRAT